MNEIIPLSLDDVQALRKASGVCLIADSKGRAKVNASLEKNDPADFTSAEARTFPEIRDWGRPARSRTVLCNGNARTLGGMVPNSDDPLRDRRLVGSYVITSPQFDGAWRTVTKALKAGDGLELRFVADHATHNYLREAGLHGDDLFAVIWTRVDGKFQPHREFLVTRETLPHNSARMVRGEGDPSQLTTFLNIDDYWNAEVPA